MTTTSEKKTETLTTTTIKPNQVTVGQDVKKKSKRGSKSSKSSDDGKGVAVKKVAFANSAPQENFFSKDGKPLMFPISEDRVQEDLIPKKPSRRHKMIRHRSRTQEEGDKDERHLRPANLTRTISFSDSISPKNMQERELCPDLLLNLLETDSEDDIALKNLRRKLADDMKKERSQTPAKFPLSTKKDTDNLVERLNKIELLSPKTTPQEQLEERGNRKVALRQKPPQRISQARGHHPLKKESRNRDTSQESSLIKTNSVTSESHTNTEILNELSKIHADITAAASKQQENHALLMTSVLSVKKDILAKLETENTRPKRTSASAGKKIRVLAPSYKKDEEKKVTVISTKKKDYIRNLEQTLEVAEKDNGILKKQVVELELKVRQLEMEANFWKTKYNALVESAFKNSSSN
jgi:hypothetical protein